MAVGRERSGLRGGGCALCGGPLGQKQASSPVAVCTAKDCARSVCLRHVRYVDGKAICTSCLRDEPADVQANALKVGS